MLTMGSGSHQLWSSAASLCTDQMVNTKFTIYYIQKTKTVKNNDLPLKESWTAIHTANLCSEAVSKSYFGCKRSVWPTDTRGGNILCFGLINYTFMLLPLQRIQNWHIENDTRLINLKLPPIGHLYLQGKTRHSCTWFNWITTDNFY